MQNPDEAAKLSIGLKTSLSESTSDAQCEITNSVATMSNRLATVRDASSAKPIHRVSYECSSYWHGNIDVSRSELQGRPTVVGYVKSSCFVDLEY